MSNLWRQSPSGRFTSENLATNKIAKGFWEVITTILLIVSGTIHLQNVENVTITLHTNLTVQNSTHSETSESPVITQVHNLIVQESYHNQTSDNIDLIWNCLLTLQNSSHNHLTDNIIIEIQSIGLDVQNILHNQYINNLDLVQNYILIVQNSEIGGGAGGGLKYWSGSEWVNTSIKVYT